MTKPFRAGFVGVVGLPNAGKSTLVNILTQEKVSIVTDKPQTTRRRVLGIVNGENSQIVLVDSPGLIRCKENDRDMLKCFIEEESEDVIKDVDGILLLLNIDEKEKSNLELMIDLVVKSGKPWAALISKVDIKAKAHRVMMLREKLSSYGVPVLSVSGKKSSNNLVRDILIFCEELIPKSPGPLYGEDIYTLDSVRNMVSEFIREQCFMHLYDEVPFGLAVTVIKFDESREDLIKVHAQILIEKENHRPIIVGKGGSTIKKIGTYARSNIEKLVGKKVFLDLKVKVHRWSKNKNVMKELGYAVTKT